MTDYNFSMKASEAAKLAYQGIKVDAKRGTSLAGFRKYTQNLRVSLLKKWDELEEKKDELRKTYQFSVVDHMTRDTEKQYNDNVAEIQSSLTAICERILNDKREANKKYAMIPPSEEIIRLINAYNFRDKDNISDTEFNYLVSTAGDNYQSLRMVEKLANDCGRVFTMPYDPDEKLNKIDLIEKIAKTAIANIAVPNNEIGHTDAVRFFNYDGEEGRIRDAYICDLIDELDNFAGTRVPDDSIIERLQAAQKKAYDDDNITVSAKINAFLDVHGDKLLTANANDFIIERAEQLIQSAYKKEAK